MKNVAALSLAMLLSTAAQAAEYMEKTPFQLSRAFSPGVITSGGIIVWVAGQTATQDSQGNNIANNFEAQVKQVFAQVDGVLKRAGGSLDNVVTMTVFIKESRYGDRFVDMRKEYFKDGNYPGSALITVTNFARPGIEIEIQAVGVIGDSCSNDNPCSAEAKAKKAQNDNPGAGLHGPEARVLLAPPPEETGKVPNLGSVYPCNPNFHAG
jgi:2-iminobutanoate/2-iminopropanoate deaminase